VPTTSVAFFCANACAQSSQPLRPGSRRVGDVVPRVTALSTIELVKLVDDAAVRSSNEVESRAARYLTLKWPPERRHRAGSRQRRVSYVAFHDCSGEMPFAVISVCAAAFGSRCSSA
jgi:hypothetical protein